jgi:hypothetical protein
VRAFEGAWDAIRHEHPEVPPMVIVTGQGSSRRRGVPLRLGQFAAARWRPGDGTVGEVMVSGEGLTRGAPQVFATLLHEAAHALAREREIRDTSREGRYHNRRFKRIAEELGLRVECHERRGWAITELDPACQLATTTRSQLSSGRWSPTAIVSSRAHRRRVGKVSCPRSPVRDVRLRTADPDRLERL